MVEGVRCRVQGIGYRVSDLELGCRVQDLGFRVGV